MKKLNFSKGTVDENVEGLIQLAKATALNTFGFVFFVLSPELVDLVQNHLEEVTRDPQTGTLQGWTVSQNYLFESCKGVRANVLSFIQAIKSRSSNPYDFMIDQNVDNTS